MDELRRGRDGVGNGRERNVRVVDQRGPRLHTSGIWRPTQDPLVKPSDVFDRACVVEDPEAISEGDFADPRQHLDPIAAVDRVLDVK